MVGSWVWGGGGLLALALGRCVAQAHYLTFLSFRILYPENQGEQKSVQSLGPD